MVRQNYFFLEQLKVGIKSHAHKRKKEKRLGEVMKNNIRDRLIELLEEAEGQVNNDIPSLEMIADELIANGVVLPPCKVGDTVYYLDGKTIVKDVVHCISFGGRHGVNAKGFIHMHDSDKDNITISFNLFGKTVFLTKDQAEQKLKELSENGNL